MSNNQERSDAWLKRIANVQFDTFDFVRVGDRLKIVADGKEIEAEVTVVSFNEDGTQRVYLTTQVSG